MFLKKKLPMLILLFLGFTFFTSCDDDDKTMPVETLGDIVDLAIDTPTLSTLVAAVQQAELVDALKADGPLTVLAPNNDAFQALLDAKPTWESLGDIPSGILDRVLKYHVISGSIKSSDLTDGQMVTTLSGDNLTVDLSNGVRFTTASGQSISVTNADIDASNGVIHLIDGVLLPIEVPMNIVDLAVKTPSLSSLVAAVQKAGLVDALVADGTMTVFAPDNNAFDELFTNLGVQGLDDLTADDLKPILLFHVLGAEVRAADLSDTYVNTLSTGPNDEPISLQVQVSPVRFNGDATPNATDIEASNGVIHTIKKVMLPPNVVTLASNNPNFSMLVEALTATGLPTNFVDVLSGEGPFTVFAPTNTAFQTLLDSNSNWNTIGDIPTATLDAVLKYHVVSGANVQADQLTNGNVTTLGGTITLNGTQITTSSNGSANIIVGQTTNDVQGKNGVIHAIDAVLLP